MIGIGFDAGTILKAAVADGIMYGGVTQSPYKMGYYAMCALVAAANGQEVYGFDPGASWYDAANMNDPDIAMDLYD